MSQNLIASVKDEEDFLSALPWSLRSLFTGSVFPHVWETPAEREATQVAENKSERGWVLMGGGYYRRRVHSHTLQPPTLFLLCECERPSAYLKWMHRSHLHPFGMCFWGKCADTSSFLLFAPHAALLSPLFLPRPKFRCVRNVWKKFRPSTFYLLSCCCCCSPLFAPVCFSCVI